MPPDTTQRLIRPMDIDPPAAEEVERFLRLGGIRQQARTHEATQALVPTLTHLKESTQYGKLDKNDELARAASNHVLDRKKTLDDLLPYRIKTMYRVIRELARQCGVIEADGTLLEALTREPFIEDAEDAPQIDPWGKPLTTGMQTSNPIRAVIRTAVACRMPLTLSPPEAPFEDMTEEEQADYDPTHDEHLKLWTRAVSAIADQLYIEAGTQADQHAGIYGMAGITDLAFTRIAWPGRIALLGWEQILVEEVLQTIVDKGVPQGRRILTHLYGFQPNEMTELIKVARGLARTYDNGDLEESRSMMILRLEKFINRAQDAMNVTAEMQALKQISLVIGLTKADPEDALAEFTNMAKRVTNEARQALPKPEQPLLEG